MIRSPDLHRALERLSSELFDAPVIAFICMCLSPSAIESRIEDLAILRQDISDARLWTVARETGTLAFVANAMTILDVEPADRWEDFLQENTRRADAVLDSACELGARLEAEGIPALVLESGSIALERKMPRQVFSSGDVDIFVKPSTWYAARTVIESAGYVRTLKTSFRHAQAYRHASDSRITIELRDRVFLRRYVPPPVTDETIKWFERSSPIPDCSLRSLPAEESLFQLSVHASLHSYIRRPGVRLYADFGYLLHNSTRLDWDAFLALAAQSSSRTRCLGALMLARAIVDAPIPHGVMTQLASTSGARLDRLITWVLSQAGPLIVRDDIHRARLLELEWLLRDV
jgi:hypothetical protein